MKVLVRISTLILFFLLTIEATTIMEVKDPVSWEFSATRSGQEATLELKAKIAFPWHLYSTVTPEGGPVPTEFKFREDAGYKLAGKITEPEPVTKYDPGFDLQVKYFSKEVIFRQKIKLSSKSSITVSGTVTYMVCDDEKCLPPNDIDFTIVVPAQ